MEEIAVECREQVFDVIQGSISVQVVKSIFSITSRMAFFSSISKICYMAWIEASKSALMPVQVCK